MSTRREAVVEHTPPPFAASAQPKVAEVAEPVPELQPEQTQREITPVVTRNVRRDVAPAIVMVSADALKSHAEVPAPASAESPVTEAPSTRTFSGIAFGGVAVARNIVGAGATFPYPVLAAWGNEYVGLTNISLVYQSIGSGGGTNLLHVHQVTFAAIDIP